MKKRILFIPKFEETSFQICCIIEDYFKRLLLPTEVDITVMDRREIYTEIPEGLAPFDLIIFEDAIYRHMLRELFKKTGETCNIICLAGDEDFEDPKSNEAVVITIFGDHPPNSWPLRLRDQIIGMLN